MADRPILITGATGQLGMALAAQSRRAYQAVGRPVFDFEHPVTITSCFTAVAPALVINAAAWTAVDAAEQNHEAAFRANRDGPAILAGLCRDAGIPLIHISTDYVFDGDKGAPYVETDPVAPLGVYGASKEAGERAVLESGAMAMVLRTSWVFSARGRNFARTMINAARKTSALRVVGDQRGTPTAAEDLAAAILTIAGQIQDGGWQSAFQGIFHATNRGETTWHGFAEAIFDIAAAEGETRPAVTAITTADWPTPVKRPADSRLDGGKLATVFGLRLPDWHDATQRVITAMLQADRSP
ncbi:dTDP-4-dehydrorhamnose reductase [Acidiphilium sp. PA]|uniref:dTDP-4-dehydrorhamnose reductase n=1 Tax=Acidiphilium sp. PA TaxID=2871705 RepID=UPI0022445BC9|nr:dTDP-4-dehydrorhamnose reductase [Acidiphilium sp. PA]MCW8306896.1 dTDP-4-dehydrorhamnose reductase [Acidiphilium sp. PA]